MTAKPILGITCCIREVAGEPAQAVISRYVRAVARYSDVAPVLIPAIPDLVDMRHIADRIDGLLLTGSPSNISPEQYGECNVGDTGPLDLARDSTSLPLIEFMIERRLPIFGICRGHQELNVALGGTLQRGLSGHHTPEGVSLDQMFSLEHDVQLVPGGLLSRSLGRDNIRVNSVHYQAVDKLAPGLVVEAQSADGIIEAVSGCLNDTPIIGVQWHPEWNAQDNDISRAIFSLFGRALRSEDIFAEPAKAIASN